MCFGNIAMLLMMSMIDYIFFCLLHDLNPITIYYT